MALIKGILHFPSLFIAKIAQGATEAKYNVGVLLPATDPQVAMLQAEVQQAKLNGCPSGYDGADECFDLYEKKIPPTKEYHDPRFIGWYLFTCGKKEADGKPSVVDTNFNPIIDPGTVYSGMVAYVNAGITYYGKGRKGIGGWLNGVMLTAEEPPMGRLDNRPSVESMFAAVGAAPTASLQMTALANGVTLEQYLATPGWTEQMLIDQGLATRPVLPAPPTPLPIAPPPPTPLPIAAAVSPLIMTAAANGVTLEQYLATPGWTEQMLIDQGLAIRTSFA